MKLITFEYEGKEDIGVIGTSNNLITPIGSYLTKITNEKQSDMLTLIRNYQQFIEKLPKFESLDLQSVILKAPIPAPPKNLSLIHI